MKEIDIIIYILYGVIIGLVAFIIIRFVILLIDIFRIAKNKDTIIETKVWEDWEWDEIENKTMKGYVIYALKILEKDEPEHKLSDEQKEALLRGLNWATDDLSAQEAFDFYNKN